ncbi:hypothetical protein V3I01_06825 [Sphingomonas sp. gentR]|uniref:hypothetical protein n=1 Tax=Sphingomonas sp. gentR TaxID=3118768 RepID=UPI0030CFC69D
MNSFDPTAVSFFKIAEAELYSSTPCYKSDFGRSDMNDVQWKAAAILTGRRVATKFGNLATCIAEFEALNTAQRLSARVIVPGCMGIGKGAAVRTLSADTIRALAAQLPAAKRRVQII